MKTIVNADDFGASVGVNAAVREACECGRLDSASLMANMPAAKEALDFALSFHKFAIGLHGNLTEGRAITEASQIPLLVRKDGTFKHGFASLFLLAAIHPHELAHQATIEIEAQISRVTSDGIPLTHLDSHRHIHAIPTLHRVFCALQKKYAIPRLRIVNEHFVLRGDWACLINGGLVKLVLLRLLAHWNGAHSTTYFYSVLHTGKIYGALAKDISVPSGLGSMKEIEIALHPGRPDLESPEASPYLRSPDRARELQTLLDWKQ